MSYPKLICLLVQPFFKAGDKPPINAGYLEWNEWAEAQRKAGITQKQCKCGKWITPQEIDDHQKCVE